MTVFTDIIMIIFDISVILTYIFPGSY